MDNLIDSQGASVEGVPRIDTRPRGGALRVHDSQARIRTFFVKSPSPVRRSIGFGAPAGQTGCAGLDATGITPAPVAAVKHRSAAEFERCYLSSALAQASGSVSGVRTSKKSLRRHKGARTKKSALFVAARIDYTPRRLSGPSGNQGFVHRPSKGSRDPIYSHPVGRIECNELRNDRNHERLHSARPQRRWRCR